MKVVSGKVIASCFALSAFAVAIIAGLASENPAAQILLNAALAMAACYVLGLFIGMMCERIIASHLLATERENPAVDSNLESGQRSVAGGQKVGVGTAAGQSAVNEEVIVV